MLSYLGEPLIWLILNQCNTIVHYCTFFLKSNISIFDIPKMFGSKNLFLLTNFVVFDVCSVAEHFRDLKKNDFSLLLFKNIQYDKSARFIHGYFSNLFSRVRPITIFFIFLLKFTVLNAICLLLVNQKNESSLKYNSKKSSPNILSFPGSIPLKPHEKKSYMKTNKAEILYTVGVFDFY